jgi:hypothetical protein
LSRTAIASSSARPRAADLLVVGDERPRSLEVDDEAEVGLVEPHSQRDRGDEGLHLVPEELCFEALSLRRLETAVVRGNVDAPGLEPPGDAHAVRHRQAVDDSRSLELADVAVEPGKPFCLIREVDRLQPQAAPCQWAALDVDVPQLIDDILDHAVVRRRRGRQHRNIGWQPANDPDDPPVVGPKVMPPIGDAVSLVHDEQPNPPAK